MLGTTVSHGLGQSTPPLLSVHSRHVATRSIGVAPVCRGMWGGPEGVEMGACPGALRTTGVG
jgi:hypothetical protein